MACLLRGRPAPVFNRLAPKRPSPVASSLRLSPGSLARWATAGRAGECGQQASITDSESLTATLPGGQASAMARPPPTHDLALGPGHAQASWAFPPLVQKAARPPHRRAPRRALPSRTPEAAPTGALVSTTLLTCVPRAHFEAHPRFLPTSTLARPAAVAHLARDPGEIRKLLVTGEGNSLDDLVKGQGWLVTSPTLMCWIFALLPPAGCLA